MIKVFLFSFLMTYSFSIFSVSKPGFITVEKNLFPSETPFFQNYLTSIKKKNNIEVFKVDSKDIAALSTYLHSQKNKCGGFFYHETKEEALAFQNESNNWKKTKNQKFLSYEINQQEKVNEYKSALSSANILAFIQTLTNFHNRYYEAASGVESQKTVKDKWQGFVQGRKDAKVENFMHSWKQPSVILSIRGSKKPDEIIVVGGHGDSIAGWLWGRATARAPGADDNASGISTITEVIRVLAEKNYVPDRTLMFMSYAAEEVGLRGSKEIAQRFKAQNKKVVGVLQLDMVNYKNGNVEMAIIGDYTNTPQNEFLGKLIDEYVKVPWEVDNCGYACSDHASWTQSGFPASFPFETKSSDRNRQIHTARDTLETLGNQADHALKFAQLALSYVMELDK